MKKVTNNSARILTYALRVKTETGASRIKFTLKPLDIIEIEDADFAKLSKNACFSEALKKETISLVKAKRQSKPVSIDTDEKED